jgi:NAD(P)-dependent dehydrogenase (short-subunit alcohol dehydrogenase family)
MTDVSGKVALVTGGASGIGLGMTRALARRGARVAICDIDGERARHAVADLGDATDAIAVPLDVSDRESWQAAAETITARLGPVRILCNNAGVGGGPGTIDIYDVEAWRWTYEVNVHSILYAMRTFLPEMKRSGEACHVVNTASMAGLVPTPHSIAYMSSKFAAMGVSFGLRNEFRGTRIGVSVLCPGMSATRIMETSDTLRPGASAPLPNADIANVKKIIATGMDPDLVGEKAIQAVEKDEFYIFSHPEWKPLVEAQFGDVLGGFGASAQPGYADDLSAFLKPWSRN